MLHHKGGRRAGARRTGAAGAGDGRRGCRIDIGTRSTHRHRSRIDPVLHRGDRQRGRAGCQRVRSRPARVAQQRHRDVGELRSRDTDREGGEKLAVTIDLDRRRGGERVPQAGNFGQRSGDVDGERSEGRLAGAGRERVPRDPAHAVAQVVRIEIVQDVDFHRRVSLILGIELEDRVKAGRARVGDALEDRQTTVVRESTSGIVATGDQAECGDRRQQGARPAGIRAGNRRVAHRGNERAVIDDLECQAVIDDDVLLLGVGKDRTFLEEGLAKLPPLHRAQCLAREVVVENLHVVRRDRDRAERASRGGTRPGDRAGARDRERDRAPCLDDVGAVREEQAARRARIGHGDHDRIVAAAGLGDLAELRRVRVRRTHRAPAG